MRKAVTLILLGMGAAALACASTVPEIDPGTGASAIALLAGTLLTLRSRTRK